MAALLKADDGREFVLYENVATGGANQCLPESTDVIAPVPPGYPGAAIDLAGLPLGSALIPRVAGGANPQGTVRINGRDFQLASYHPHTNGGGPPWDQMRHGFHTYIAEIIAWLGVLK